MFLVHTIQVNSTFRRYWLANSEVISQVLFTSKQLKKNNIAFIGTLSQVKLLFGPLVIQLVWYILKQLFTSMLVTVVDIFLHFVLYQTNFFNRKFKLKDKFPKYEVYHQELNVCIYH